MASDATGAVLRQVRRVFESGTPAALGDAQLLERFARRRGESAERAFEALVERHGPMVLGVCRQVLGDRHAAEDAFQATFLVLARRAGSIRRGDRLGNWLYGVASRVARKTRTGAARRLRHEERAATLIGPGCDGPPDGHDFRPALHEELGRLPEKYRAPLTLTAPPPGKKNP